MKTKLTSIIFVAGVALASTSALAAPASAGTQWSTQGRAAAQVAPVGFKAKFVFKNGKHKGVKKKTFVRHGQKAKLFYTPHGVFKKKTILVKSRGKLVRKTIFVKAY